MQEKSKEEILQDVRRDGMALKDAPKNLKEDKTVVLTAVQQNGWALKYASEDLQNDRNVVLAAVRQQGLALNYASVALKDDLDIVLEAIKNTPTSLSHASTTLKSDPNVVFEAIKDFYWILMYASKEFKSNKNYMLQAIRKYPKAFQYVSEELKKDKDIILALVENVDDDTPNILKNLSVTSLDLSNMEIDDATLQKLGIAFQPNTNITKINLEHNEITDAGAQEFFQFLLPTNDSAPPLRALRELRLFGNYLENIYLDLPGLQQFRPDLTVHLLPFHSKNKVIYSKIENLFIHDRKDRFMEDYLHQELALVKEQMEQGEQRFDTGTHFNLQELTQFVEDGGILSHFKANREKYRKIYSGVSDKDFAEDFNFGENLNQQGHIQSNNGPTSSSSSTSHSTSQQRHILSDNEPTSSSSSLFHNTSQQGQVQYNNGPTSSSSSASHSTSQYLNTMKGATSSSQKTIYPRTEEKIIEILKSQYNIVLTILSNLNQKAIEKNVQAKMKEIKEMFPNISTTEQSQLKQTFQKNLKEKKDLYFQTQGNKQTQGNQQILRKYKIEQFRDVYTDGPISTLNIHKEDGHFIDQSTKQKVVVPDEYYTKQQLLKGLRTTSEEQVRNLLPILRKFKDFESTKLLRKERQQRQKIKEDKRHQQKGEQDHQQKGEQVKQSQQIKQIKNSLARIQEAQTNIKLKLLEEKDFLKKKKKQMEQNKTRTHDPQGQIQKPQIIQQLQNRISNIQETLSIISNEMSRQG